MSGTPTTSTRMRPRAPWMTPGGMWTIVPLRTGWEATAGETFVAGLREAMRVHPGVSGLALSCSLGWSSTPPLSDLSEAVRQADVLAGEDKIHRKAGRDHAVPVQRAKEDRRENEHRRTGEGPRWP